MSGGLGERGNKRQAQPRCLWALTSRSDTTADAYECCYPILDTGPGLGHGQGPEHMGEGRMDSHSSLGQPSTPIQSPEEISPAHFMEELPQLARAIYSLAQLEHIGF